MGQPKAGGKRSEKGVRCHGRVYDEKTVGQESTEINTTQNMSVVTSIALSFSSDPSRHLQLRFPLLEPKIAPT